MSLIMSASGRDRIIVDLSWWALSICLLYCSSIVDTLTTMVEVYIVSSQFFHFLCLNSSVIKQSAS